MKGEEKKWYQKEGMTSSATQVGVSSGSDLWLNQVQRTGCIPRPKLQGLGIGSSTQ